MKGLILAAGVARRLYPITEKIPKCLIDIGGKPILSHQLDALRQYNVNEITIVLGYFKEMVVNYIIDNYPDMDFTFITNEHFFETNTSYSVYLCSEKLISAETVLMNGDVLYPPALLKRIIESEFDSVLAVDVKECGREEVKVIEGDGNRLVAIGKELIQENSLGEFIGVAKLSKSFCTAISASLSRSIDAGGIGPALIAGTILGKNVVDAIEANDVTEKGLWQYHLDFIEEYGYKTAGLELFRRLVQTLTNEQISYGMKHFLGNVDVEAISKGEHPDFSGLTKLGMIIRGAMNKTVASGLKYTSEQNKWLVEHYRNYPKEPSGFEEWKKSLIKTLDESFAKIATFSKN